MNILWITQMIEIYGSVMNYMNDRNTWICYVLHKWYGYMVVWWLIWMLEIHEYVMICMNDIDRWIYDDVHVWQGYMDMFWCVWIWYGLHDG